MNKSEACHLWWVSLSLTHLHKRSSTTGIFILCFTILLDYCVNCVIFLEMGIVICNLGSTLSVFHLTQC